MWSIIVFLFLGVVIGVAVNIPEKVKEYTQKLQYIGVIILLFTMGVSLGLNKSLLNNLKNIGYKSLVFAFLTSLFSVVIVYLSTRLILKEDKKS